MTSKRDIFVKTIATRRSVYSQDRLEQILSESIQAKEKEPGDRNSHVMNRLCEYDLIDLQNAHDGDYGYVLVYQDYLTKFTQLRPLKTKSPIELGTTLMDIFCIFGPPLVLQSSADLHIENSAIQQTLEAVWPGIRLYQDDSSQWRETAKLRNEQIRSMIAAWMFVNNNPRWSYGLKFVQLTLNSNINNELKRSPYEALFKMLPVLRPATVTLSSTTTDMSLQPQQQQHIQQQHHHHSQLLQPTAAVVPPSSHSPSGSANEGDFVTPNVNILPSTISTSDRIKAEM
ncbi:unnamed protein product [Rotaria socialis]|uniref:Integrase catalytic domain-containing protein n=1 Tax=Rotaria socialis TaxID=392032 RepID=A0A820Z822_9BILA|nr:unnamed protein product [Rotaria socialis]